MLYWAMRRERMFASIKSRCRWCEPFGTMITE